MKLQGKYSAMKTSKDCYEIFDNQKLICSFLVAKKSFNFRMSLKNQRKTNIHNSV